MEKYSLYNILVFGLPGSGKSTFAKKLAEDKLAYFNADQIRTMFNDWDFTEEGRTRQAERMFALTGLANGNCVVDFVCPYNDFRNDYDITVWMNTIKESKYENTNKLFEKPVTVDYEIKDYNYESIINEIKNRL
jgi:adenylylsulfate kinase|tara:strand:- start:92 stop:493 length:402 start_codon:yes stop_codon:yes gene_type:complete